MKIETALSTIAMVAAFVVVADPNSWYKQIVDQNASAHQNRPHQKPPMVLISQK